MTSSQVRQIEGRTNEKAFIANTFILGKTGSSLERTFEEVEVLRECGCRGERENEREGGWGRRKENVEKKEKDKESETRREGGGIN